MSIMRTGTLLSKNLKHLMVDKDISATDIAKRMNLARTSIYHKFNNPHTITVEDLAKFADIFKVSIADLFAERKNA